MGEGRPSDALVCVEKSEVHQQLLSDTAETGWITHSLHGKYEARKRQRQMERDMKPRPYTCGGTKNMRIPNGFLKGWWALCTIVLLQITVGDIATGHLFPSGATEERDVWLHVAVHDRQGNELQHIPVPPNPDDPNDRYFITSNRLEAYPSHSSYSKAIARDALPEGDRIYQDVFLDSNGNVIFGQWYAVRIIGNRLEPGETRTENYSWEVPQNFAGKQVYLRATLWYRRMADSHAELLGIDKRPHLLVSQDEKIVQITAN